MINDFLIDNHVLEETYKSEGDHINKLLLSDRYDVQYNIEDNFLDNINIIFDSGCTSHICSYLQIFDYVTDHKGKLTLPDKRTVEYFGRGKIGFLDNVLWTPTLDGIYISISKLDKEGYKIIIYNGILEVYDKHNELICKGIETNGLYYYDKNYDFDILSESINNLSVKGGSAPRKFKTSIGNMSQLDYLHHRWGHPSEEAMKEGIKRETIHGTLVDPEVFKDQKLSFCPDCHKGKLQNLPSKLSETDYEESGMMDFMATDSKGPFSFKSRSGYYYFDLFSFKKSRWLSVKFKARKNEVYKNIKEVLLDVEKLGYKVKHIQTDDDAMYRSNEFIQILDDNKILKRTSVAYHHYSNGWIERNIRTILDKARTIMLIYNTPLSFWQDAIQTAVDLYNWTPNKGLNWKTPYEMIFNQPPDISHLVPFYSPGLVFLPKEDRNHQLSEKSLECRMIGYDKEAKNAYLVWIPSLMKVKRAVNCRFLEGIDTSANEDLDISRFKTILEEEQNFGNERIKNQEEFFESTDEPYFHLEDALREEEEDEKISSIADDFKFPPYQKQSTKL